MTTQAGAVYAPPVWAMDPAAIKRIGVWCWDGLHVFTHVDPFKSPGAYDRPVAFWHAPFERQDVTFEDVARIALKMRCGAVWLLPLRGAMPSAADPRLVEHFTEEARAILRRSPDQSPSEFFWHELSAARGTKLAGLVAQRIGPDGTGVGLPLGIYATWIDAWNIAGVLGALGAEDDPERRAGRFAAGVALAAYALQAQLRFSPSYTGITILRQTLQQKQRHGGMEWPVLSAEWRERLTELLPAPVQWARPPVEGVDYDAAGDDPTPLLVRKYDRIASYVASAREVPCGDPLPTSEYVEKCPGVYRIIARAPESWHPYTPGPFAYGDGAGEYPAPTRYSIDTWAWEPQIRIAERHGWEVSVQEGFYWPRGKGGQVHDLLRAWQDRVWQARLACEAYGGVSGAIGKAICKRAGVATIGRMLQRTGRATTTRDVAREQGLRILSRQVDMTGHLTGMVQVEAAAGRTDLVQPGWWGTVIANANERLMAATYDHAPLDTLVWYIDAAYTAFPHPALAGSQQSGKFKLEKLMQLTRSQVRELQDAARQSAQAAVKYLAHVEAVRVGDVPLVEEDDEGVNAAEGLTDGDE